MKLAGVRHPAATPLRHLSDPRKVSPEEFPEDGAPEERLWFALNYAVLAPSSHNTQPWRFRIRGAEVEILADRSRALPVVDPFDRELTMSCGAALLHLRIALQYFGQTFKVSICPDPEQPDLLARVELGTRGETDSDTILLFPAMATRRTHRQRFLEEPVPGRVLEELDASVQLEDAWFHPVIDSDTRAALADLVAEADRRQWADRNFRLELSEWVRPQDHRGRDGLSVASQDLGKLMSHVGPLAIRTFDLGKGHAAKDRDIALYSPVLAVLGTENDDPAAWMAAGQALGRLLLQAQSEQIVASFLNQPIEVPVLRTRLDELIGYKGNPQLLLRMGYGQATELTPRRAVNEVLIPTTSH